MKLWKRNAVVAAVVLFVCVAVYLNWSYQDEVESGKILGQAALVDGRANDPLLSAAASPAPSTVPDPAARTGYFASARLNRQEARDSALAMLRDTMDSETAEAAARTEAGDAIETLAASTVSEAQIENLVVAKGYQDCVTFITDGGASVVVSSMEGGLQDADVARITEIVTGETGLPASAIKIIEAEP